MSTKFGPAGVRPRAGEPPADPQVAPTDTPAPNPDAYQHIPEGLGLIPPNVYLKQNSSQYVAAQDLGQGLGLRSSQV